MDVAAVAEVLRETRSHVLSSSDANYAMAEVGSTDEGLRRVDAALEAAESGEDAEAARLLFAPTGWLQDLSVAAGWGDEFLVLAARLDAAVG